MTRLKFVLFAVVALGLWAYHLQAVSPVLAAQTTERASAQLAPVSAVIAGKLESQRSAAQAVALKVLSSSVLWNSGQKNGKPDPLTAEKLAAVRAVANEVVAEADRGAVWLALSNEAASVSQIGAQEVVAALPEGLDLSALQAAGSAGSIVSLGGVSYWAFAGQTTAVDKNEVKPSGTVVVGLPVVPDLKATLETLVKEARLEAAGLVSQGAVVSAAGLAKTSLERALKLKAGETKAVVEGPVSTLGPLALPLFVGSLPHEVATHQALVGTPFTVVAVVSVKSTAEPLAAYQRFALLALAGLVLLALVVTVLLGSAEEAPSMVAPPPMPVPARIGSMTPVPARAGESVPPSPIESLPDASPAPEANPDDFSFPTAALRAPAPVELPKSPEVDPFAMAAPAAAAAAAVSAGSSASLTDEEDEGAATRAYPVFKPPVEAKPLASAAPLPAPAADPFASTSSPEPLGESDEGDSTRVAAVPQELIRAARAGTQNLPVVTPSKGASGLLPRPAAVSSGPFDEERHFQETFREFLATREKCGEAADGLTFEKFKGKLLKNKEQLVAKYACKAVRFQVYVKEGKAALKATPIKD